MNNNDFLFMPVMGTDLILKHMIHENIEVVNNIQKLSGIKETISVNGAYDCVVKTEKMESDNVANLFYLVCVY